MRYVLIFNSIAENIPTLHTIHGYGLEQKAPGHRRLFQLKELLVHALFSLAQSPPCTWYLVLLS